MTITQEQVQEHSAVNRYGDVINAIRGLGGEGDRLAIELDEIVGERLADCQDGGPASVDRRGDEGMTITETHRPSQFEGQETEAEKRFDEAMESIKDVIPRAEWRELSDQASGRALDAYDFGVLIGLGKIVPLITR